MKDVVLPELAARRERISAQLGKPWIEGEPVPRFLRSLILVDGEIDQIKACVELYEAGHFKEYDIAIGKLPASCSGLLQPMDRAESFKVLKAKIKALERGERSEVARRELAATRRTPTTAAAAVMPAEVDEEEEEEEFGEDIDITAPFSCPAPLLLTGGARIDGGVLDRSFRSGLSNLGVKGVSKLKQIIHGVAHVGDAASIAMGRYYLKQGWERVGVYVKPDGTVEIDVAQLVTLAGQYQELTAPEAENMWARFPELCDLFAAHGELEDGEARGMNIPMSRMDAADATDRSTHTNLSRHRFVDLFRDFQVQQREDVAVNDPDLVMAAPVLALLHEHGWDLGVVLATKDASITAAIYGSNFRVHVLKGLLKGFGDKSSLSGKPRKTLLRLLAPHFAAKKSAAAAAARAAAPPAPPANAS